MEVQADALGFALRPPAVYVLGMPSFACSHSSARCEDDGKGTGGKRFFSSR